jgi:AraC-like DNA-binding protein
MHAPLWPRCVTLSTSTPFPHLSNHTVPQHLEIRRHVRSFLHAKPVPKVLSAAIKRLVTAIHEQLFDDQISVKVLKAHCDIQDNNISCRFKRELGMTIREYIESLRLEAACIVLERYSVTAADAAYLVGYDHIQTFYRAFKRQFRCTPGEYRIQAGAKVLDAEERKRGTACI